MGFRDSDLDPLDPFASQKGAPLELDASVLDARRATGTSAPEERARGGAKRMHEPPIVPTEPPPRALELAAHGEPPAFVLEGPYVIAVARRNRTLRQRLPELRRVRDQAARDLEADTLELGRALQAAREHPKASELGTTLRRANAARKLTSGHDAELDAAREAAQKTTARIEASIATATAAIRPLSARARELQAQMVVFQQDFEVASAAIHEATTELTAMEKAKRDDVNRRIELEATRTLRRADADAAVAQIDARTPELRQAEAKIAELERSNEAAAREIQETAAALARTEARIAREAKDATEALERALVELADEAVRLRLDHVIAPAAARRARLRHDTWAANAREVEMHELALTLHHPRSLRRGRIQLALLALAVLAWLVWLVS